MVTWWKLSFEGKSLSLITLLPYMRILQFYLNFFLKNCLFYYRNIISYFELYKLSTAGTAFRIVLWTVTQCSSIEVCLSYNTLVA